MNGTSLAALLGVATWFGTRSLPEEQDQQKIDAPSQSVPSADLNEQGEFNWTWASNSLLQ